jgi:hypothetical protein
MSWHDETGKEHEALEKTSDGKPLLSYRRGLSPLPYNDNALYIRTHSPEIIFWLLNAASAGIIGNIATETLKRLIGKSRKLHHDFSAKLTEREAAALKEIEENRKRDETRASGEITDLAPLPWLRDSHFIRPDRLLRDDLVELTYDTLARYRQLKGGSPARRMSEIDVFLTQSRTWAVRTRELGAESSTTVEIDLREEIRASQNEASEELAGFPVIIWPSH